jgi:putative membrane-bound dehydrogenase-like protein
VDQFEIHPAFQIERAASEPVVKDPVDLQFDEHGHAYVVEMGGYPFAPDNPDEHPGKVVRLDDTDQDGIYDRRTVFADRFAYASSILPHQGGILVASPPDLLFLKDTNGDGRADLREVWLSGFAVGNSQHNVNGLIHGLDNWIYAGNGGNSGTLFWPHQPDRQYPVRQRDMRFHFPTRTIDFFGPTTTGFSIALDDWNHVFTTHNTHHVNHLVFPLRYVERNPHLTPRPNPDISDHKTGNLDRAYPIGIQDTRLNHPEQSGFFSCACGITFYGGGAFPAEFQNALFVCDSVMNLVHHDALLPHGPGFIATRTRAKTEFLATANRHSRPVNLRVGPEGALYVIDMYRVVIEHPEWIPDELEKEMDLYAGQDQGRIYRITPKPGLPKTQPAFPRTELLAVVAHLGHPNKWWRDTAQRLLAWWNDPQSVIPLRQLLSNSTNPLARVHALWTLTALSPQAGPDHAPGALTEPLLLQALRDPHPGVRENALMVSESQLGTAPHLIQTAIALTRDPDPRVRMQAILTLGDLDDPPDPDLRRQLHHARLQVLRHDLAHDWSRFAVLTTVRSQPEVLLRDFLARFPSDTPSTPDPATPPNARTAFLSELAELIGTRRQPHEINQTLLALTHPPGTTEPDQLSTLVGLNTGLAKAGTLKLPDTLEPDVRNHLAALEQLASTRLLATLWGLKRQLSIPHNSSQLTLLTRARTTVTSTNLPTAERLAHLQLLEFTEFEFRETVLWQLQRFEHPRELQTAALRQLLSTRHPTLASELIRRWPTLSRENRALASDFLILRPQNHLTLLEALESELLPMGQLNLDLERRRRLLWSDQPEIRRRAEALFSDAGIVTRADILAQLKPATRLNGSPDRGRVHYENLCAQCHTIGSLGHTVGPDLTEISRKGPETLLSDLFDPNAAVNTEYLGFTLEDDEDEILSGIVTTESDHWVTLRSAGGISSTVPRARIRSLTSSGLSLMPEGLEAGLSLQDIADLLAFLQVPR